MSKTTHTPRAATTLHTPRPAVMAGSVHSYYNQRFYGADEADALDGTLSSGSGSSMFATARVARHASKNMAYLSIFIGNYGGHDLSSSLKLDLKPGALRDLAARLLDAAHDIDRFPADLLKKMDAAALATTEGGK